MKGAAMKLKQGGEMSKLTWSFLIPVMLLVVAIIAFFIVDAVLSADNNAEQTKKILIEQTVQTYRRMGENFQVSGFNPSMAQTFNPELIQSFLRGDYKPVYDLILNISVLATPSEAVALVTDGKVYSAVMQPESGARADELLTTVPKDEYKILGRFGKLEGTLVNVVYPIDLTKVGLNSKILMSCVFDLTAQVRVVEDYFTGQRNDTIIWLGVIGLIALLAFVLLSTFWLRHLIGRYVSKPIKELNDTAEEIVAGTYQGEVVVNSKSDFAAIQGLLKSGQLILRKHDEEVGKEAG